MTALALSCGSAMAQFTNVVKSGVAVPGQATNFTNVNIAGIDSIGGAAFIGSFTVSATNYSGLYHRIGNGAIQTLVDRNTVGPQGETINSIIATGDYENGGMVFAANTTLGRTLYRYAPNGTLTKLAREGDVLPGSTSPISTFYNRGVSGDQTDFAFGTAHADGGTSLYSSIGGIALPVADNKTRVPVAEMGDFIDFPEVNYRNGATAFVGRGMDPDNGSTIPETAGVFVARPGNPIETISHFNEPIPGAVSDDFRFHEFERPRIMPDGRIAFAGGFINETNPDPLEPRHMGVFIRNPDLTWKSYIDSNMNLPGLHSIIEEFNQYSIETDYNYFGVNDITGGSYIYYESAEGVFTKLIDTYSPLDGKSLSQIRLLSDTALDGGQVFFRANFTDGTTGIYTISVPEPTSLAAISSAMLLAGLRRRARRTS